MSINKEHNKNVTVISGGLLGGIVAGDVYLGGSYVSSTDGMTLTPGESIQLQLANPVSTAQFWADAANNNDQVDFIGSL